MKALFLINDAPYTTQRTRNGLDVAEGLALDVCPKLDRLLANGVELGIYGASMDACGVSDTALPQGVRRATRTQLAA